MIPIVVCPVCRRELRPLADPRREPTVVSCQCGAQLFCRPHSRRPNRFSCHRLTTDAEILTAWNTVRLRFADEPAYPRRFVSVEAFYQDDERRRHSRELDFGVWWYCVDAPRGPYRVSWVDDTGDLYAVLLGPPAIHAVGADALAIAAGDEGAVVLLAHIASEQELEERLAGWPQICGQPASLRWLWERVQPQPIHEG